MPPRRKSSVPGTPRVISPSPTPSESQRETSADLYDGPVTRSVAKKRLATPQPLDEEDEPEAVELRRSRTRSRSPIDPRRVAGLTAANTARRASASTSKSTHARDADANANGKAAANGHLQPPNIEIPGWSWRDFSRSPSPLGLIPIHRHWRTFIHRHEVPRKVLHVSIGFLSLWLYLSGTQTNAVCPWLMGALIPIAATDYLRHHYAPFNRFYVRVLGAFMRESEYAGWNGVVFYLLGAWIVLYSFPKDVGLVSILLLSWCDTAASTFGRMYGAYTPRLRRGKSLAGSLAAFTVGVASAGWFWGWLAPRTGPFPGDDRFPFMFTGSLHLPDGISGMLGLAESQTSISGAVALGVMSIWSGLVAAGSEVVDLFGWDDNLTIPVLSGIGIWGFLKTFG